MRETLATIAIITFLAFHFYFLLIANKRYGEEPYKDKSIFDVRWVAFKQCLIEPWKTKYRWAGIVQIILFFVTMYLANF